MFKLDLVQTKIVEGFDRRTYYAYSNAYGDMRLVGFVELDSEMKGRNYMLTAKHTTTSEPADFVEFEETHVFPMEECSDVAEAVDKVLAKITKKLKKLYEQAAA